jgi:cytoskeletal protein CcmA (bactofilin family)
MFGKKKGDAGKPGSAPDREGGMDDIALPPLKPFSRKGSHAPAKPPTPTSFHPEVPRRSAPEIPGVPPRRLDRGISTDADSKRLVIGRDICLSGEITSCDRLVVEGRAEVSLQNARIIEVAPTGFFKGTADVEEADVSGRYEGELIVRDRLVVRAGGRISGTIRYGRIVIESGGEISGDMQTLEGSESGGGEKRGQAKSPTAGK